MVLLSSQYRPLHDYEFRVLRLEGYDESGILKCTLQHASFVADSHEPYCAISYTWKEERVWYGKYDYTISQPIWIGDNLVMVSNKVSNILSMMFQVCTLVLLLLQAYLTSDCRKRGELSG